MRHLFAGLALIFGAAGLPSASLAAPSIDCMDQGYSAAETADFERFYSSFRLSQLEAGPGSEILAAVTRRSGECAEMHGWSGEAIEDAVIYRFFGVLQTALERNSPFTEVQMRRLSAAVAATDQERLGRIVRALVNAGMNGELTPEQSQSDLTFLGRILIRAGVPVTEETGRFAGALIAAWITREQVSRRFGTL